MRSTPNAKLVRLVDAAVEPVALADMKNFLRVEISDDDALIGSLITAARMECEKINNRSFITTTWQLTLDYFPPYSGRLFGLIPMVAAGGYSDRNYWLDASSAAIQLPMPPLIAVSAIDYLDTGGNAQTLDPSPSANQVRISPGTPGQLTAPYGSIFPLTLPVLGAVSITYTAGYGPDPSDVPASVILAIRFLVAHYYEHRTDAVEVPPVVKALLDQTFWGQYN